MSGHGLREAIRRADALVWRDSVVSNIKGDAGAAAARRHHVSPALVAAASKERLYSCQ